MCIQYQTRDKEKTLGNGGPRPAQDDLERLGKAQIALVVVVAGDGGNGISHQGTHLVDDMIHGYVGTMRKIVS